MEDKEQIPPDIKRFILTSIDSVPHLEAVLLLRYNPQAEWDAKMMAQSLYMSEKRAGEILADLCASGFSTQKGDSSFYLYHPSSLGLKSLLDQLADNYAHHLVEVTQLIHSKINKQAQQFGDAFKWQKEKE